jgi:long-subunit fatty acid transport protein
MPRRAKKAIRIARLALAALALAAPSVASAHAPGTFGLGSRGAAMGGAIAASVNDFSAGYYNPAALAAVPGLSLSVGYFGVDQTLRIDGRDTDVEDAHGVVFGIVAPGKIASIPFAFGLAAHLPDRGLSRIKALREGVPRWELYDTRPGVVFLAANLAIQPIPEIEIGGGMSFLAATEGSFRVTGTADLAAPYDSRLVHEVDADLTSVRYPQVGARAHLGELVDLALVYRGQAELRLAIDANLRGDVDAGGIRVPVEYSLSSRTVAAFLPQQVVLGTALKPAHRLIIEVDVTWVEWSAYPSPTARTAASLDVDLPPGLGLDLPPDVLPTDPLAPSFEDRFVPRFGVEWVAEIGEPRADRREGRPPRAPVEIPFRAGYVFEASPVPPQTRVTNYVDTDRHTVSFGTGVAFGERPRLALDGHLALSILPVRVTEKASAADFIGDYSADGIMVGGGGTATVAF